jgi:hypothetical protein
MENKTGYVVCLKNAVNFPVVQANEFLGSPPI